MMIREAIDSAANEHAIYFLVTAYIESLQHFDRDLGIPASVVKLPVEGLGDLEERLTSLMKHVHRPLESVIPASEVMAVLASAVKRLGQAPDQVREKR
jgi:hypothetical protein